MSVLETRPGPEGRTKADPDDNHLHCCDPDVSLCGLDISGTDLVDAPDDDVVCLVCLGLKQHPCGPGCPVGRPS